MAEEVKAEAGFLRRWSQRKQAVQTGQEIAPVTEEEFLPESAPSEVDALAALEDKDMPPIETLTAESDFSGFLSPKVSSALRRKALRKLFHIEAFNITDGLNDYDEDFRTFEPLGDVVVHNMRKWLDEVGEDEATVTDAERAEDGDASPATRVELASADARASAEAAECDWDDDAEDEVF